MWHMGNGWGWWMLFGTMMMVGFWVTVVWAVVALSRRPPPHDDKRDSGIEPSARDILERRYANGELSHEEFETMRRKLSA